MAETRTAGPLLLVVFLAFLALLVRSPAAYDPLTRTDDDKEVCEVEVRGGRFAGQTLRKLALPGDVLVLALSRDGELTVPRGNSQLDPGDRLTLVGSQESIDAARRMFDEAR